jgi:hypothetical protein
MTLPSLMSQFCFNNKSLVKRTTCTLSLSATRSWAEVVCRGICVAHCPIKSEYVLDFCPLNY